MGWGCYDGGVCLNDTAISGIESKDTNPSMYLITCDNEQLKTYFHIYY